MAAWLMVEYELIDAVRKEQHRVYGFSLDRSLDDVAKDAIENYLSELQNQKPTLNGRS